MGAREDGRSGLHVALQVDRAQLKTAIHTNGFDAHPIAHPLPMNRFAIRSLEGLVRGLSTNVRSGPAAARHPSPADDS